MLRTSFFGLPLSYHLDCYIIDIEYIDIYMFFI